MKSKKITLVFILLISSIMLSANKKGTIITNNDDDATFSKSKFFNFGIGASSWGIPLYANLEFPLNSFDNVTLSVGASYQTKKEDYGYFFGNYSWRHTIIGIQAAGNYYVDDLLELPDAFDLYGGLQLEYYIWKTKFIDDDGLGFEESYSGSGSGGIGLSGFIGGRYHFGEQKKLSLNILLGAGTVFSSGRVGLSLDL